MRIKLPIKELQSTQLWVNYSPSALIRPGTGQREREKENDKGVERVTKERCDLKAGGAEEEEKKRKKKGISLFFSTLEFEERTAHFSDLKPNMCPWKSAMQPRGMVSLCWNKVHSLLFYLWFRAKNEMPASAWHNRSPVSGTVPTQPGILLSSH